MRLWVSTPCVRLHSAVAPYPPCVRDARVSDAPLVGKTRLPGAVCRVFGLVELFPGAWRLALAYPRGAVCSARTCRLFGCDTPCVRDARVFG